MSLDAGQTFTDKVYLSENNRAVSSQKKLNNGIIDKAVLVAHILEQRKNTTSRNYFLLTFRKGLEIDLLTGLYVSYLQIVEIDFYVIPFFKEFAHSSYRDWIEAESDAISVIDSRNAIRNNEADSQVLDHLGCLLAARSTTEIIPRHDYVSLLDRLVEIGYRRGKSILHHLFCRKLKVRSRRDGVGIDILTKFPNSAFDRAHHTTSLGSTIFPASADAATVAGEPR